MPPESPGQAADGAYAGRDLEALAELPNYHRWILGRFAPYLRGAGIELGAGIGTISEKIRPSLDTLEVVEPSANLVPHLRGRFAGDGGVTVTETSLEDRLASAAAASFDTAVMVNVLEHIEDDGEALSGLFRILRPGGHLLLFVPAMPALYSAFDREVGHFRRYRRAELGQRLSAAAFRVVDLRYMDTLGIVPWWLVNTIGGRKDIDPRMAGLYDRIGVPVTRAVEGLVTPPCGKNLIAVAERP